MFCNMRKITLIPSCDIASCLSLFQPARYVDWIMGQRWKLRTNTCPQTLLSVFIVPLLWIKNSGFSAVDLYLFSYLWLSLYSENCKFRKSVILSGSLSHWDPRDGQSVQIHSGLLRCTVLSTDVMSQLTATSISCFTLGTFWYVFWFFSSFIILF